MPLRRILEYTESHPKVTRAAIAAVAVATVYVGLPRKNRRENGQESGISISSLYSSLNSLRKGDPYFV